MEWVCAETGRVRAQEDCGKGRLMCVFVLASVLLRRLVPRCIKCI
jgi:hypothetical protein